MHRRRQWNDRDGFSRRHGTFLNRHDLGRDARSAFKEILEGYEMGNMDEMMKEIDEILNGGNEKASIKMNEIVRKARGKLEGEVNEG